MALLCFRHLKIYRLLLKISILTIFFLSSTISFAASGRNRDVWVIRQSSNFAGTIFSELASDALRMRMGSMGLTIITKAPKWDALIYRDKSKAYIDMPYKNWDKSFLLGNRSSSKQNGSPIFIVKRTGNEIQIAKCRAYECLVLKKEETNSGVREEKVFQVWVAKDIKAPLPIAQMFCAHLRVPAQSGIPLQVNRFINGKPVSALETILIEKHSVPTSTFGSLPGYRKVKDELELVMEERDQSQDIEDLLDEPSSTKN